MERSEAHAMAKHDVALADRESNCQHLKLTQCATENAVAYPVLTSSYEPTSVLTGSNDTLNSKPNAKCKCSPTGQPNYPRRLSGAFQSPSYSLAVHVVPSFHIISHIHNIMTFPPPLAPPGSPAL